MYEDDLHLREGRGTPLLLAHVGCLDPEKPSARERLDEVLGPELAHMLVFALAGSAGARAA